MAVKRNTSDLYEELELDAGGMDDATPDDVAVNSLLSEIAGDVNSSVTVYRTGPNQKNKFLFKCHPGDFSLEQLRDEYGGGDFRLYITKAGALYKNVGVSIEPPRRVPEQSAPKVVTPDLVDALREMQRQNTEQMQLFMLKMTEAMRANIPPPIDPIAMQNQLLAQLASMKNLFSRDEGPRENPLDNILKGIELAKSLQPAPVGEANTTDVLMEAIRTFGKPLAEGVARLQETASDSSRREPSPIPAQPAVKKGHPDMNVVLRMQLKMLVAKARLSSDPALYADLILDSVAEEQVRAFLLKPTAIDDLIQINPEVAAVRPWFEAVITEIRAALDGEEPAREEEGEEEGDDFYGELARGEPARGELNLSPESAINPEHEIDTAATR